MQRIQTFAYSVQIWMRRPQDHFTACPPLPESMRAFMSEPQRGLGQPSAPNASSPQDGFTLHILFLLDQSAITANGCSMCLKTGRFLRRCTLSGSEKNPSIAPG